MRSLTSETHVTTLTNDQILALTINGVTADPTVQGTCPHCGIDLNNGVFEHNPSDNYKCDTNLYCCMGCNGEFGPLLRKRKGVSHAGKTGARNKVSVKQWLRTHPKATYAESLAYVTSTGRTEITLRIQMRNLGRALPKA